MKSDPPNRQIKITVNISAYMVLYKYAIKSKQTRFIKNLKFKKLVGINLCTATKSKATRNTKDPDTEIIDKGLIPTVPLNYNFIFTRMHTHGAMQYFVC